MEKQSNKIFFSISPVLDILAYIMGKSEQIGRFDSEENSSSYRICAKYVVRKTKVLAAYH